MTTRKNKQDATREDVKKVNAKIALLKTETRRENHELKARVRQLEKSVGVRTRKIPRDVEMESDDDPVNSPQG